MVRIGTDWMIDGKWPALVPTRNSVFIESVEFEQQFAVALSRHGNDHSLDVICVSAGLSNPSGTAG